ncbi:unnamed protein product [Porites lobata]|uniref:Uncharacterized protein n=1 Tax=Porites lobata TaxID=104759 RepID=A0ABN8P566_9CNID|nr:unnamed protein product [Porites lobata]
MGYFNKINTGYYRSEEMPNKQRQCVTSLHPNECILSIDDWTCAPCKALQPALNIYLNRYNWDTPETMHVIENGVTELVSFACNCIEDFTAALWWSQMELCSVCHNHFLLDKENDEEKDNNRNVEKKMEVIMWWWW